jgi:ankyrin repeat protein
VNGYGRQSRPRKCNVVAVVFANAALHASIANANLAEVKISVTSATHSVIFEGGKNVLHLCATASAEKTLEVMAYLLNCEQLEDSLSALLSASDCNGQTPFSVAIRSDKLSMAELILDRVQALEKQVGKTRWNTSGDSLHARSVCAPDSGGWTALHHLCASKLDESTIFQRTANPQGNDGTRAKLVQSLLNTTDTGTVQDESGYTAFASMLVANVRRKLALRLARDRNVVQCTIEGSSKAKVSTTQLDRIVFSILTWCDDVGESNIIATLVCTIGVGSSVSCSDANRTGLALVQSAVRVFVTVCASGTLRPKDMQTLMCERVRRNCRQLFCMIPVLAIQALVEAADAVITPVRLGTVNTVPGLDSSQQGPPLGTYELRQDVFAVQASSDRAVEEISGELGISTMNEVHDEAAGAESDGDAEAMTLSGIGLLDDDGESGVLASIHEGEESEEGGSSAESDDAEEDMDALPAEEDEQDDEHDPEEDIDADHNVSRDVRIGSATIGNGFLSAVQHVDDTIGMDDDMLDHVDNSSSAAEKEKVAAVEQSRAASLYACVFDRIIKEVVQLSQELLADSSRKAQDDEAIRQAISSGETALKNVWQWLFLVMDSAETQLRAVSPMPQDNGPDLKSYESAHFQNALLNLLRAQHEQPAVSSSNINICQYRSVAYVVDAYLYLIGHTCQSESTTANSVPSATHKFFQRTPSTTPHGGTRPVNFRATITRGLPLAEKPHLLTPRATKRAMFGDDDESTSERPAKRLASFENLSLLGYTSSSTASHGTESARHSSPTQTDILVRWEATLRRLADAFLADIGAEPHSFLPRIAGFRVKQTLFRQRAAALRADSTGDITAEVCRSSLLEDLFATLDREFSRRRRAPTPLVCRHLKAIFKGEKGEGDGVTRGLLAAASSTLASCEHMSLLRKSSKSGDDAALFHAPGKDPGIFAPLPVKQFSPSRLGCLTNVGRLVGLSLLHNLPISLAFTRPTVKFLLGREVSWTDLAFHNADLYENLRQLLQAETPTEFEAAGGGDLTFEVTDVIQGSCQTVELRAGGASHTVGLHNAKEYARLYAAYRMVDSVRPALAAMRRGLLHVLSETALAGLTAEDFVLLLNGCGPRVEVGWLRGITAFRDSRTAQSRASGRPLVEFEKLFWAAVSRYVSDVHTDEEGGLSHSLRAPASMTDAERRELLYFSTGSPVHPHDFGGRRLTVHVKSDTKMLPNAQVPALSAACLRTAQSDSE